MSKIILSKVIKKGKLIDNYLVNFPLFINKLLNSIYKLVINLNITCFIVNIPENNYRIRLPFYLFKSNHALYISWGDRLSKRGDINDPDYPEFLEHTYTSAGTYEIYIIGETPQLFSIFDNCLFEEAKQTSPIYIQWEIEHIDYYSKFVYTDQDSTDLEELRNKSPLTEAEKLKLQYLEEKEYLYGLKNNQYLRNFMSSLIGVRKLSDSLTDLRGVFKGCANLTEIPDEPLPQEVTSCQEMFYACTKLEYIPFNFALPEECTNFQLMFAFTGIKMIFNDHFTLPYKTSNVLSMFRNTPILLVPLYLFNNVTSSLTTTHGMFYGCDKLLLFTTTKPLPYITDITLMFQFCSSLRTVKFDLPNLLKLYATFSDCKKLKNVEGIHINLKTLSANLAFSGCVSLDQDVNEILTINTSFAPSAGFTDAFSDCVSLRGAPRELYLWKSYYIGQILNVNMFKNCTMLLNYNFITPNWGGPEFIDYWYGSYQIQTTTDDEIYCLPLYKFIHGNSRSQENLDYSIKHPYEPVLTPYDFYISYGDDSAWFHVNIGTSVVFENFWLNDQSNPFFGYPKTYKINFDISDGIVRNQTYKMHAYLNLINYSFFGYIFRDIMHIYKKAGTYKVRIMGMCPRFYVSLQDFLTNRQLRSIFTINNLPFLSLDHAFTNAYNLEYLPNESLLQFPLLHMPDNYTIDLLTHEVHIDIIPQEERVYTIPASETSYCFAIGIDDENKLKIPNLFQMNSNLTTWLNRY